MGQVSLHHRAPGPRLSIGMKTHVRERLAANADVFRHLLEGIGDEQARWKPAPDRWSLLEVINHLADEERFDFRRRIDFTLHRPDQPWPPIDPPRWVVERGYNERDLDGSLQDFLEERGRSLEWLDGLVNVRYEARYDHPVLGPITVGDLLTSWLAHDMLHVRQMARLHYLYGRRVAGGFSAEYAGEW